MISLIFLYFSMFFFTNFHPHFCYFLPSVVQEGRRAWLGGWWGEVVRVGLPEKLALEQRLEGGEGSSK